MALKHLHSLTSLRFQKTAGAVAACATARVNALTIERNAVNARIQTICDRRELSLEEVLAGAESRESLEAYSTRITSAFEQDSNGRATRGLIAALQADLDAVAALGKKSASLGSLIAEFECIAANTDDPSRIFDLTLNELTELGF